MGITRCIANITAGVQTPILRFDLSTLGYFAKTRHIPVEPLGERFARPFFATVFSFDFLTAPEADDVAYKFNMIRVKGTMCSRQLTEKMLRIDKQHFVAAGA